MKLGRDVAFDFLRDLGVKYLFGVPGTNEIPLIDGTSLSANGVSYIPCLHENIAMGAAMGYPFVGETWGCGAPCNSRSCAWDRQPLQLLQVARPREVLCAQQHSELLLQEPILASDLVRVAGQ